jgi:hypothetical protein
MMDYLCGDEEEKWARATQAAVESLQVRLKLWDGIVKHKE